MSAQAVRPEPAYMDTHVRKQPAVVLVATDGDWAGRSLESVLVANGYAVLRSGDGEDALALAKRFRPDALILDEHLAGLSGIDICRLMRAEPEFDMSTPIVITAPSPSQRAIRQAAYDAGAWDFCTHPLEADTLILKLGTFLRGRQAVAHAREQALIDSTTGVLSAVGMERWAEQLMARASRNHEPLACVVLMPPEAPSPNTDPVSSFLQMSRDAFRRSDVVGRTGDGRLALLAPDTDSTGVEGMLARLRAALSVGAQVPAANTTSNFKAGYWAIQDFASNRVEPAELIRRAAMALDHISTAPAAERLAISFDQLPVS
jgi:PleD family two-component response regulator